MSPHKDSHTISNSSIIPTCAMLAHLLTTLSHGATQVQKSSCYVVFSSGMFQHVCNRLLFHHIYISSAEMQALAPMSYPPLCAFWVISRYVACASFQDSISSMQVYFVCLPQATEPKVASVIFQLTWIKAVAGDNGWLEVSELSVHVAVECRGEGALSVYYHLRVLVHALIGGFGCSRLIRKSPSWSSLLLSSDSVEECTLQSNFHLMFKLWRRETKVTFMASQYQQQSGQATCIRVEVCFGMATTLLNSLFAAEGPSAFRLMEA
jgi:hypothetical protein